MKGEKNRKERKKDTRKDGGKKQGKEGHEEKYWSKKDGMKRWKERKMEWWTETRKKKKTKNGVKKERRLLPDNISLKSKVKSKSRTSQQYTHRLLVQTLQGVNIYSYTYTYMHQILPTLALRPLKWSNEVSMYFHPDYSTCTTSRTEKLSYGFRY